ncbi:MAG: diguanylate cyclase response regulator [Proteobacteria bacterium]|nr:diguanylate cyclase response regulator [Pseudomonadota bacterium]
MMNKITALRRRFFTKLPTEINLIGDFIEERAYKELREHVHRIKGGCAILGLRELFTQLNILEQIALELERCLELDDGEHTGQESQIDVQKLLSSNTIELPKLVNAASYRIELLKKEMASILLLEASFKPTLNKRTQVSSTQKEFKVLFLCQDPGQYLELVDLISLFRYTVIFREELSKDCDVGFIELDQIKEKDKSDLVSGKMPWVAIGKQGTLAERLEAVRLGAQGFVDYNTDETQILKLFDRFCKSMEEEPYRILIYDDDLVVCEYFALHLQRAGMKTKSTSSPKELLDKLSEWGPDLVMLDVHTPICTGVELAGVIRQQDEYLGTPIVFISSTYTEDVEFDAIRVGGDEILYKSTRLDHLIDMVQSRAERARKIRALSEKDSLTGLLNHTRIKARLATEVNRASRMRSSLSFVMIDIDNFKSINDSYGHLVGDQVIQGLARLLNDRFRLSDAVGRYGGEEFAVVMPDCTTENAVRIFEELRIQFSQMRFQSDSQNFMCTFSAGISSYHGFQTPELLNEEADQALYISKKSGRNRVSVSSSLVEES